MRILHLSSEYPPERVFGLGRYVQDIARELVRQGHQVAVLTNSLGGRESETSDAGVQVHRVQFPPPPKPPGSVAPPMAFNLHLQQRAQELGSARLGSPEAVVSHDWLTAPAAHQLARRWGIPHVWTVHDTVWGKTFGKLPQPSDQAVFRIERWATANADLILVNSSAIMDEVAEQYGGQRAAMRLVHCGVDPARFASTFPPERIAAFRSVFAAPDELLVTFTGRLDLEKGIDTLVNAFAILHAQVPRSRLAIVGRGVLQDSIREHVDALKLGDAVRLYGYLSGEVLKHVYLISDVHVCPSHYEPFGIVAAEAMAAGTPVVVSATGGLTDLVSSPEVGCRFPARDHAHLARILVELAGNRAGRKALGRAGAAHIAGSFAWPAIAARAAACYGEAVARSAQPPQALQPFQALQVSAGRA
jgi:glycogen(starch) synthase